MQRNATLSKADLQLCPAINAMVWYDSSHCALALVPFLRRTVNLLRKEVKDRDFSPRAWTVTYLPYSTLFHEVEITGSQDM
jgi:hypothetical protein